MVRPRCRSACSCLNLILACIVYWQAWEISWVFSQCDAVANGIDLSLTGDEPRQVRAEKLLVAAGRRPNSDRIAHRESRSRTG